MTRFNSSFPKYKFFFLFVALGLISHSYAQKDSTHFVTTWKTNNPGGSNDSSITINIGFGVYDFDVDWNNDGVFDTLGVSNKITHQYNKPGIYTIRIKGDFPNIGFGAYSKDKSKIIYIDQWGNTAWGTMSRAFEGCDSLEYRAKDAPNLSNVKSLSAMFWGASKFNGDISNWDVSTIVEMRRTFADCHLFNQDIGNWNVDSVKNMSIMFRDATSFNQDLSNWNVSNVSDMHQMFYEATSFNQNIGDWDVSNVQNMSNMFNGAVSFNQDISSWDVGSVTLMEGTFLQANTFNQDLSNWDVSKVSIMRNMFVSADAFDQNIGDWDIKSVVTMNGIFAWSGLSRENYDSILISWEAKPHKSNVEFDRQNGLIYCHGDSARSELIKDGWSFSGDTLKCLATAVIEFSNLEKRFEVYPNPTNGILNIKLIKNQDVVSICNSNARLIKQLNLKSGINQIDLGEYPSGLYFIQSEHQSKKVMLVQ